jgi:hypothetical protein
MDGVGLLLLVPPPQLAKKLAITATAKPTAASWNETDRLLIKVLPEEVR